MVLTRRRTEDAGAMRRPCCTEGRFGTPSRCRGLGLGAGSTRRLLKRLEGHTGRLAHGCPGSGYRFDHRGADSDHGPCPTPVAWAEPSCSICALTPRNRFRISDIPSQEINSIGIRLLGRRLRLRRCCSCSRLIVVVTFMFSAEMCRQCSFFRHPFHTPVKIRNDHEKQIPY